MAIRDVDSLLESNPQLHRDGKGGLTSWALDHDVLRFVGGRIGPETVTLETGIGVSTVVFALGGGRHTTVAHHADEIENVRRFCDEHGISLERVKLVQQRSEDALPGLRAEGALDLVLIDGRHAFPTPFVDWYYTVDRLKVGGVMVVDDLNLKTGRILADYMTADHRFATVAEFYKTTAFEKLEADLHFGEFDRQPWMNQA